MKLSIICVKCTWTLQGSRLGSRAYCFWIPGFRRFRVTALGELGLWGLEGSRERYRELQTAILQGSTLDVVALLVVMLWVYSLALVRIRV